VQDIIKPPVIFWVSHGDFRALDETKTQTSIISWSVKVATREPATADHFS
jgi:hypothetical protein